MKKSILTFLIGASAVLTSSAESEILKISLNDGSVQTINVSDIRQMTFEDAPEPSITDKYTGEYSGTVAVTVGGMFTYNAEITCGITAGEDETITVRLPEYVLSETVMGDLTLGTLTIDNLIYDGEKGGFYRSYGGEGLTQHVTAVKDGATTMDSDYTLNDPSTILIKLDETGKLVIENPFKLGAMPFPLTAVFEGRK